MSDEPRLPLARLLLVGALVPAVFSALDHWLLDRLGVHPSDTFHLIFTMGVFIVQVGLMGWLCGRLLDDPRWRWGLFVWSWLLVDLHIFTAAGQISGTWHPRMLPQSLFAAQVGLTLIWAILGTTTWMIRLPVCAVMGTVLSVPLQGGS